MNHNIIMSNDLNELNVLEERLFSAYHEVREIPPTSPGWTEALMERLPEVDNVIFYPFEREIYYLGLAACIVAAMVWFAPLDSFTKLSSVLNQDSLIGMSMTLDF
ncbi:MAG: hypothetical protein SFT81_04855 [Candidatus Caenarcaniphilales bacterium]|nr:hypothetical protein [Candidatus Caenarcaniphilales bacterium]